MPVEYEFIKPPAGWYVQIEFADPRRPTARMAYGGIEIRNGKIRVPFASRESAELARQTMIVSVAGEAPVVAGEVLPDPPAIVSAEPDQSSWQAPSMADIGIYGSPDQGWRRDKGDGHDCDQQQ